MGYTKEAILKKCDTAMEKIHLFYKQDFINYRGRCTDTDELYSEVIAQYICEHVNRFVGGIKAITREASYKTESHIGKYDPDSPRVEELTAMKMFNFDSQISDSAECSSMVADAPPFILTSGEKLQKDASWSRFACHGASLFVMGRIGMELKSLRNF